LPHAVLHQCTLGATSRFIRVLRCFYLADHELKCFADILVEASTSLCPGTFEFVGESAAGFFGDLTLFGAEIRFVADYDEWNGVGALDIECE
jgi:hypothetical protein